MSSIKLIISDLHLTGAQSALQGFGDAQQAALEGLTAAAASSGEPLGRADDVELIINGDAFDFLATSPYDTWGASDVPTALEKLHKIIAAHRPFFETLRHFRPTQGRHVTFITRNPATELRFQDLRALL